MTSVQLYTDVILNSDIFMH